MLQYYIIQCCVLVGWSTCVRQDLKPHNTLFFFAVIHDIMMFLLPYVKAAFLCGLVAVLFDLEKFGDHHDPSDSYIWYVE